MALANVMPNRGRTGPDDGNGLSHIDSKGQQAVKCSHEASSIRKLALQDTNGSFFYSKFEYRAYDYRTRERKSKNKTGL